MPTQYQRLFLPTSIKESLGSSPYRQAQQASFSSYSFSETGSFSVDPIGSPLKSTQQLNVDWSQFENHTFFMSAEVKTNLAFDRIINSYPFDGSQQQLQIFMDSLTGFEKYIYDAMPKYKGALQFSGSYIRVQDYSGAANPDISSDVSGDHRINPPAELPLTIEAQVYLPATENSASVICQKSGSNDCFTLFLSGTSSTGSADCVFLVTSGTTTLSASAALTKGAYNHICVSLDKVQPSQNSTNFWESQVLFYLNESLASTSDVSSLGKLQIDTAQLLIGSGTSHLSYVPESTLKAAVDEFRVYHSLRDLTQQREYASKPIYSDAGSSYPLLRLYYKFNEPPPPLLYTDSSNQLNSIVLDSSGNSLHAYITNFTGSLRVDASYDALNPMTNEVLDRCPILFPGYQLTSDLMTSLLSDASEYDSENPNIITRLIPNHYLLAGASNEGFAEEYDSEGNSSPTNDGLPRTSQLAPQQIMLTFLYIWAKYFDELKLFVDAFSTLKHVDHNTVDTVPDNLLGSLINSYGLNMPNFFGDAALKQYVSAENIERDFSTSPKSLRDVQVVLSRRILVALPQIISSKGTINSVNMFLRAVGLEPGDKVKIKEHGGPSYLSLENSREQSVELGQMLDLSLGKKLIGPFLSGTRVEPGFPTPAGTQSDGLFTSGSWTLESLWRLGGTSTVSLGQLLVTGSSNSNPVAVLNLIATPKVDTSSSYLNLFLSSSHTSTGSSLKLYIPNEGCFDSGLWSVSFGIDRKDSDTGLYAASASLFLRAARQGIDKPYLYSTACYAQEVSNDSLRTITSARNASGSYFALGQASASLSSGAMTFSDALCATTSCSGLISNLRFWSYAITDAEWREHANNPWSTGVDFPYVNNDYNTTASGSFERLRLDAIKKQPDTQSTGSYLELLDTSSTRKPVLAYGFLTASTNFVTVPFHVDRLSTAYDESATNNKVRVRGLVDEQALVNNPWAKPGPIYSVSNAELPTDDPRLSVEFSLVSALNKDIVNIFSNYKRLSNLIGSNNLSFSNSYEDLDTLSDNYFKKMEGSPDFKKFFEFYRWFDTSIDGFITQLLPKKTYFKGVNFVVEPHMLERSKFSYHFADNYRVGRTTTTKSEPLSILTGPIRRY